MLNSKLSIRLWVETVYTTCYTKYRVYLRPSTNKTTYEIWKGKKPNLSYFNVFGCTYYIINDQEQIGKFQVKSDKGMFLGYSPNSRTYKIYNLHTKTIMESINVVVDDFNDIIGISREDEVVFLTKESENQLQKTTVAPNVAT